jgi:hypothetical protein
MIQFSYLQINDHRISSVNHLILAIFIELIIHIEHIFFLVHLFQVFIEELCSASLIAFIPDSQFIFHIVLFSKIIFQFLLAVKVF